jgi:hypothetical protein
LEFSTSNEIAEGMERAAALWQLIFWDLFWILGGVLFIATAWLAGSHHQARGTDRRIFKQPTSVNHPE